MGEGLARGYIGVGWDCGGRGDRWGGLGGWGGPGEIGGRGVGWDWGVGDMWDR